MVDKFLWVKCLTFHPGDAGASPEWANVLATVEALDGRASAPDGGVRVPGRKK